MKISELWQAINEAQDKKQGLHASSKSANRSKLSSAASLNDPVDSEDNEEDGEDDNLDAVTEFKRSAKFMGDKLYIMTSWQYPDAWSTGGSGENDLAKHTINNLADSLGSDNADISSYNDISDKYVQDHRSIDLVVYNDDSGSMFQISGSALDGADSFEVIPSVDQMRSAGLLKPNQIKIINVIKDAFTAWCNSLPEDMYRREGDNLPNKRKSGDRAWAKAEARIIELVGVKLPGFEGDSDPGDPDFWRGVNTNQKSTVDQKLRDEHMDAMIKRALAKKAALANKDNSPRDKR